MQQDISKYIDHTLLKAEATEKQILNLCQEAKEYAFAAVCVNPAFVQLASQALNASTVKVATVIGFPLGANTTAVKVFEAQKAFADGADEADLVINIGALKDQKTQLVLQEIAEIVALAQGRSSSKTIKVILETALLTLKEKRQACQLVLQAGADFVKTSTGFANAGATVEDIKLIKSIVQENVLIKASGGIKTYQAACSMIEAGANRIGTSSGVEIVRGS